MKKGNYGPSKSIHYYTNPCSNRAFKLRTTEKIEEVTCKTCIKALNPIEKPKKKKVSYKKSLLSDVARQAAMDRKAMTSDRVERKCLRCGHKFISVNQYRICQECKYKKEWCPSLEGHAILC